MNEQQNHLRLEMQQKISRKYPVLDHLPRSHELIESTKQTLLDDPDGIFDLFLTGNSGVGKEAVAEQLLKKTAEDLDLRPRRFKRHITRRYYSLALSMHDAMALGRIPFGRLGEFRPEDYNSSDQLIQEKLDASEQEILTRPLFRVIETVAITDPILNLGAGTMRRSAQRAKKDPHYHTKAVGIVGTEEIEENAAQTRDLLAPVKTTDEVQQVLKRRNITPDGLDDPEEIKMSMGNRTTIELGRSIIFSQTIALQDRLHDLEPSMPHLTEALLRTDPEIRSFAITTYMKYLFLQWGFSSDQIFIAENTFLPKRKIPYYRRYIVEHRL